MDKCLFVEPWIGKCDKPADGNIYCCKEHAKEKCQVCGEQATTRCQASIGLMCGTPLCHKCGSGQMCLYHASEGPLMVIRGLLGGGPVSSIFASHESYSEGQKEIDAVVKRLRGFKFKRYEGELKDAPSTNKEPV